jgi:hypothetical protein
MADSFIYVSKYNKDRMGTFSDEDKAEAQKLMRTLEKFSALLARGFADAATDAAESGSKWFYLGAYTEHDEYNGYKVFYLLSNRWMPLLSKYYEHKKCLTVRDRLNKIIKSDRYNNGIDPITEQTYNISVFTTKTSKSMFKNGIVVSRDGIEYK